MSLALVTPPTGAVMSLVAAKKQIRVYFDDDDYYLQNDLIPAVPERCETATGRALLTQTWDWFLDGFPKDGYLEIPKPPLQAIVFIKYYDMSATLQTWDPSLYLVEAPSGPRCSRGRVALPFAAIWPITLPQMAAVQVRFTAGYGTAAQIPRLLVAAMKMDLGSLYENREGVAMSGKLGSPNVMPMGVQDIYSSYKSHPQQRLVVVT